jgi:glycogen(starch) synthase
MAKLRVLYVAGPGNVLGTYRCWARGEDDPGVPDVAYSRQFFDVCRDLGAAAWVIAAHPEAANVIDGDLRIEHRPIPLATRAGAAYHLGRTWYTLGLLRSAIAFGADVMVVNAHGVQWPVLAAGPLAGIKVVPTLHNSLWLPFLPTSRSSRLQLALARPVFSGQSFAILSHPGTCARQVAELCAAKSAPIYSFIPHYRRNAFPDLPRRGPAQPPFRVLFIGRIEADKGVFDMLEVARQLATAGRLDFEFDLCGSGSALDQLRTEAAQAGVAERFRCHGRLQGRELRQMFGRCHAVVVPTRADFSEGFNAVVAEAVIAGRPVVTSAVCPALDLVRDAAVEVPPGDAGAYRDALVRLCDDVPFYEARRAACDDLKAQFFDGEQSWGAALGRVLLRAMVQPERSVAAGA